MLELILRVIIIGELFKPKSNIEEFENMGDVTRIVETGTPAEQNALIVLAKSRFTVENLGFMWAIINYTKLASKQPTGNLPIAVAQIKGIIPFEYRGGANTMGKWLYDTYIDPNGPLTVNIPSGESAPLAKIAAMHGTPFTPPDFAAAYKTIAAMMDAQ